MMRWRFWAATAGVCLIAGPLAAQGGSGKEDYADEHHRNDCRLAGQVLTLGQPADRRAWALETAPTCGASGGQALAAVLDGQHGAADGVELEALVFATSRMRDGSVFQAGLRLGADAGAGDAARAAGWRVALYQLVPGSYAAPVEVEEGDFAGGADEASSAAPVAGAPLPADAAAQARQAVQGSQAAAATVREAMDRLLAAAELEERIARVCTPGATLWDDACTQAVDADEAGQ
jgi:hypothetical protein